MLTSLTLFYSCIYLFFVFFSLMKNTSGFRDNVFWSEIHRTSIYVYMSVSLREDSSKDSKHTYGIDGMCSQWRLWSDGTLRQSFQSLNELACEASAISKNKSKDTRQTVRTRMTNLAFIKGGLFLSKAVHLCLSPYTKNRSFVL